MELPQRLSEASFRRFEKCITVIMREWPHPVNFFPRQMGYSPITFSCRLRDAMTSFAEYKWSSPIDWEAFISKRPDIVVSHQGEHVIVCRLRDVKRRKVDLIEPVMSPVKIDDKPTQCTIHCSTLEQKQLLCELAVKGAFHGAIDVSGLSNDEAVWLEDNFDVNLRLNKNGNYTLI